MLKTVFSAAVFLMLLPGTLAAASDPFVGKWKLDVTRSKYPGGTCPKSMVIEMKPAEQGVWYHSDALYKTGGEIHAQYSAVYNGKPVIVTGDRGLLLPVSLRRIAPRTVIALYWRGMQVVARSRREVSSDGRLMSIITTSWDAGGKKEVTVGYYRRQ